MRLRDLLAQCQEHVAEIFPWDLKERLDQGADILLLDVREPNEYAQAHIAGSLHVPRGILEMACEEGYEDAVPQLVAAREREIVTVCRSGQRSLLAARSMQLLGYSAVASLKLGLRGWNDAELPLVDGGGKTLPIHVADGHFAPHGRAS